MPQPQPTSAVFLLRMPHALKEALDAYAHAHDLPTSEAIRQACAELVGCDYSQQHGNTQYASKQARKQASNTRQRQRAAHRRQLLRKLNASDRTRDS
jgi:hypothetical protein